MAETWRVYPGGGGDYTDLQTAEDAKDGDLSGRGVVSFECDNSGDCGEVLIAAWTNEDSSNYVRIAAETGSEHDGTNATTGAYITCANGNYGINIQRPYVRVERMQINVAHGAAAARGISLEGVGTNSTIDGCLIRLTGSPGAGLLYGIYYSSVAADSGSTVRNCIMYGQKSATTERGIASFSVAVATWTRYYYNNSIYNMGQYGIRLYISNAGATLNVTATNNVSSGSSIDFYDQSIAGTRNITSTYNASTDATATDATWNGTGCISGQSAASMFDTPGTNVTPKSGGPLENAGATIGSFDNDAVHNNGTGWRPQGASWDIGAIELTAVVPPDTTLWQELQLAQARENSTNAVSVYSPDADTTVIVKSLVVTNTSAADATVRIFFDDDGSTYDESTALAWDVIVPADSVWDRLIRIPMNNSSGNIAYRSSVANALTVTAFGSRKYDG